MEYGHAVITYLFKHGGEAAHIIPFESEEIYEGFDFDKWFLDRMMHEGGMFPLNGCARISIDTIARVHYEVFEEGAY